MGNFELGSQLSRFCDSTLNNVLWVINNIKKLNYKSIFLVYS